MHRNGGILYLSDPLNPGKNIQISNAKALVFNENGRCLSRAQDELFRMRQQHNWICVAAGGAAVYIALALAAQLPVDRLALQGGWLEPREKLGRELNRLRTYALRNMSLVIAEVVTFEAVEEEIRFLSRGMQHAKLYALEEKISARRCLERWPEN